MRMFSQIRRPFANLIFQALLLSELCKYFIAFHRFYHFQLSIQMLTFVYKWELFDSKIAFPNQGYIWNSNENISKPRVCLNSNENISKPRVWLNSNENISKPRVCLKITIWCISKPRVYLKFKWKYFIFTTSTTIQTYLHLSFWINIKDDYFKIEMGKKINIVIKIFI